ncbi:hypothetical protein [Enterococcus faecalis]|uniref:hypothetical protein n=1 Tax=Enterococcus faecalis TaxID=1351 RepID=UPI00255116A2|nr:hypothetical protein [Enterococcus faecalis]
MKEVIDAIFLNNGFKKIPIVNPFSDTVSFWGNYSKKATNFYLIINCQIKLDNFSLHM